MEYEKEQSSIFLLVVIIALFLHATFLVLLLIFEFQKTKKETTSTEPYLILQMPPKGMAIPQQSEKEIEKPISEQFSQEKRQELIQEMLEQQRRAAIKAGNLPTNIEEAKEEKSQENVEQEQQESIEEPKSTDIEEKKSSITNQNITEKQSLSPFTYIEENSEQTTTPKKRKILSNHKKMPVLKDLLQKFSSNQIGDGFMFNREGDESIKPNMDELKRLTYMNRVIAALDNAFKSRHLNFDLPSRLHNFETVLIIDKNGNLSTNLIKSTGHNELDNYLLDTINYAGPVAPIPKYLKTDELKITLTVGKNGKPGGGWTLL